MDKVNEARLRTVIGNYLVQAKKDGVTLEEGAAQVKYPFAVGPLCGAVFAKFYTDAFCSNKYVYLRSFVLLGSLVAGYKWAQEKDCKEKLSFLTRNFHAFPQDIQMAI